MTYDVRHLTGPRREFKPTKKHTNNDPKEKKGKEKKEKKGLAESMEHAESTYIIHQIINQSNPCPYNNNQRRPQSPTPSPPDRSDFFTLHTFIQQQQEGEEEKEEEPQLNN
jgi:hypothetical protein